MRSLRAIAVDDDADARGLSRKILETAGYEVDEAEGSDGLFEILATRSVPPDVILLDLTLTGRSGWQILRELKADPVQAQVPVIVVSGRDEDQFREAALDLGACAYVTKPYQPVTLRQVVNGYVRGGRSVDPWVV